MRGVLTVRLVALNLALALGVVACLGTTTTPAPTSVLTSTVVPSATPTPTAPPPTATRAPTATATETPAPTETPPPTSTPTATATPSPSPTPGVALSGLADLVGQTATVWGRVVSTASFSKGFKFTLDDGTGQVTLLLWHDVYDACADAPGLNVGAQVRAVGEVGTYDGELQLEPQSGDAVDVLAAGGGGGPLLEAAALGDALGQRVAIEGELVTVQDAGSGTKLFVSDGTGQALVFIWDTVLTRIPGANPALGTPGTRLRVTGQVKEYEGTLELVPVLPYDVEILQ